MKIKRIWLTVMLMALCAGRALAWEAPCIDAPHDWHYEDETRSIAVNRVSEDNLTWYVADVQIADGSVWKSVTASGMAPLTTLVAGTDAVLAINGDDFGTHKYGVIIRNGKLMRKQDTTRHMLIVESDGNLSMVTDRKQNGCKKLADRLLAENVWQTYEFGPALIENGEALSFPKAFDVIS
ncbi:MAG: phosphodiester glycosidase family protein, partial [Aristaeellaceae bacterium]